MMWLRVDNSRNQTDRCPLLRPQQLPYSAGYGSLLNASPATHSSDAQGRILQ